tara:strand:- start:60 stop:1292 length:1233 start_codon:yes stop_codon:yes gene_type:complete
MTSDTRSPEEIERDIERERAGLSNTLDDLQDRFSVETMARQVSDQFREHGGEIGRSVTEAVKRNPVAVALTGVGLAWLMLGDRTAPRRRHDDGRDDRYREDRRYYDTHRVDPGEDARVGATGMPGTARPAGRASGAQPGDRTKPSYSGTYSSPAHTPSWARQDVDEDGSGSKMRDAASDAGDKVSGAASRAGDKMSGAASSAADAAREAGSSVADSARSAGGSVSEAGRSVADGARDFAASASDRAAGMRAALAEGTEDLSAEARLRVIAARERAIDARNAATRYARQGRDKAADAFEEQPLIAGALAVALGAALGAALPRSRVEDRYLGDRSDQLMDEAERIYAEEKHKLTEVAKAARDEAQDIAAEAKSDAESAAKEAVDKAKVSGERIADAAEAEAKKQNVGHVKSS